MPMSMNVNGVSLDNEAWTVERFDVEFRREGPFYINTPVADPAWVFVDAQGHEHRWDGPLVTNSRWVVDEVYWCEDCRDEHERGHTECSICGEEFEPGTHYDEGPHYFPGPTEWTVEVIDNGGRYSVGDKIEAQFGDQAGVLHVVNEQRKIPGDRYLTLRGGPTGTRASGDSP